MTTMNALERIKTEADIVSASDLQMRWQLKNYDIMIETLQAKRDELFTVESSARSLIDEKLQNYKNQKQEHHTTSAALAAGYKPISHECLKWRTPEGWPTLAVFSLYSPECFFSYSDSDDDWGGARSFHTSVPDQLRYDYSDVFKTLKTRIKSRWFKTTTVSITSEFSGVIPDDVRAEILKAQSIFGDHRVFLLAEGKFEFNSKSVLTERDPVVVGLTKARELWYVTKFDTTPVEELILTSACEDSG